MRNRPASANSASSRRFEQSLACVLADGDEILDARAAPGLFDVSFYFGNLLPQPDRLGRLFRQLAMQPFERRLVALPEVGFAVFCQLFPVESDLAIETRFLAFQVAIVWQ